MRVISSTASKAAASDAFRPRFHPGAVQFSAVPRKVTAPPPQPSVPLIDVVGLCRFSYLGEGGFRTHGATTLQERRNLLYDPRRLASRMIWFEHVFLPALCVQTDPDFTLVVLTGDDLPDPFRSQLQSLLAHLPQARLVFRPPGPHRDVCAEVLRGASTPGADVTAQFRLDDDDAVAIDYVARIRQDFVALSALYAESGRFAVDCSMGILLDDARVAVTGQVLRHAFWSCAMTLYLEPGDLMQALDFPHHKVWQQMPTLTRSDRPMFVRGAHQTNDSRITRPEPAALAPRARLERLLQSRFRIDLTRLETALAAFHAA